MRRLDTYYWLVVGVLLTVAGAFSVYLGIRGGDIQVGPLQIAGAYSIWRGAVVLAAGLFFLRATTGGDFDQKARALVFMGSVMVWIVGGTELLTIILGAIPGGPDVWLASPAAFIASVAPPYPPAVLALLVTFPAYRFAENDLRTLVVRLFGRNGE